MRTFALPNSPREIDHHVIDQPAENALLLQEIRQRGRMKANGISIATLHKIKHVIAALYLS